MKEKTIIIGATISMVIVITFSILKIIVLSLGG